MSFGVSVFVSVRILRLVVPLVVSLGSGLGFRLLGSRIWASLGKRLSWMAESNSKKWLDCSIRQSVFGFLEKNPLLTAKSLCKLLDLPYERY